MMKNSSRMAFVETVQYYFNKNSSKMLSDSFDTVATVASISFSMQCALSIRFVTRFSMLCAKTVLRPEHLVKPCSHFPYYVLCMLVSSSFVGQDPDTRLQK